MTSEARRFPLGLTLTVAVAFAVMVGLGVWQLRRHDWKEAVLAKITALQHAPPQPLAPVLARAASGADVEFTRVEVSCGPAPSAPARFSMGVENGDYVWRPLSLCSLAAPPYDGIMVDRGVLEASRGKTAPGSARLPAPGHVVGVLRRSGAAVGLIPSHAAPLVLVVERETPPAPGVTISPWASAIPERLQYAGEYAPTWFGLAGALACVYAALLWRRLRTA